MKKIVLFIVFSLIIFKAHSQIHFGRLSVTEVWMDIERVEDNEVYLRLKIGSDLDRRLSTDTRILFKLADDSILEVEGELLSASSKSYGSLMIGNIATPIGDQVITEALFVIPMSDMEQLYSGVKKMRVSMTPKPYTKEWKKDWLGQRLKKACEKAEQNKLEDDF